MLTLASLRTAIGDYTGLLICAAGNESNDIGITASYPSCFDLSNIISVGACDNSGNPTSYTNTGDTEVDIFAPGYLATTGLSNQYIWNYGTSLSAPLVAGVAALLKSYDSTLTTAELKAAILDGAATKSALEGLCVSGGMLDAYGALLQVTGKLKNYYSEVKVSANSNFTTLACSITYNTSKVYNTWADFGSAASSNNLPLDIEPGKVAFIRSPNTSALTASGVLFKAKFSMPSSYTLSSSDLVFNKIYPSSTSYLSMSKYLIGDVNGDGSINSSDTLLILQHNTQQTTLTTAQQVRADVNFDGNINSTDTNMITQYSTSLIRTFW